MVDAFDRLARPVQKWIRHQGWSTLHEIQDRSIHAVLDDESDLIVMAPTAGGKTEAVFLPLISNCLKGEAESGFKVLSISPLKALINDQHRRIEDICREMEIAVTPWHGDISNSVKTKSFKNPGGILIITPESIEAMFVRRGPEIVALFNNLSAVVIDELHSFLDSERGMQLLSLLTRLELAIGRPVRRIGLSATLGNLSLAAMALRPDNPDNIRIEKASDSGSELRLQLKGYKTGESSGTGSANAEIANHVFEKLRGSNNLVFAGSRSHVELYADRLRKLAEEMQLPQEFFPHHASLSRDHRAFVEDRLKSKGTPTTAVCTSTLELGIDIGDVKSVAQIGAPFSVAGLRQRLGRSGRRSGQPKILRNYVIEASLEPNLAIPDRLRLGLVRSVAMIELMLEKWCEPPKPLAMHLSTLTHQILSVIAEKGGSSAKRLFLTLCERGPFRTIDQHLFLAVLRCLGQPERGLIEQSQNGLLLLGKVGEKLVEHYSFYAVFKTPEEFRLRTRDRDLGTLPIDNVLIPGMLIIFSGRRWKIINIHDRDKVILVEPSKGGNPPYFGGDPGEIHDTVVFKMFSLFENDIVPVYLDQVAKVLLSEARSEYQRLGLVRSRITPIADNLSVISTCKGTVTNTTLALALKSHGIVVEIHDGLLFASKSDSSGHNLVEILRQLASSENTIGLLDNANLESEKYHPYLDKELLIEDALSSRLDHRAMTSLAAELTMT